jgi:hypothetical protein
MHDPLTSAAAQFLQAGLLGALCVVFAIVIFLLWKEGKKEREGYMATLSAVYEQRIEDSKTQHQQMVETVKLCTQALANTTSATESMRDAIDVLRDLMQEMNNILRGLPRGR